MPFIFVVIMILGVGIAVLTVFVVRSVIAPKKLETISDLVRQGKTQAASKAVKAILAKDPHNSEAHYLLALCFLAESKPELALMELKAVGQVGQFTKELPEGEYRRKAAELYERFNQLEEALKEYLLLIKLEPREAEHYFCAGRLFSQRNRNDMAINYLRKCVEVDPRHGKAHYELGLILYRDKKGVEAKVEIELALKYDPDNAQAFFYLGKLLKDSHDYTGALLAFERSQRDPELRLRSLVERGGCYMSMNGFDKAIVELERAVKTITDEGGNEALYGRYFLALCHEKLRNLDKAIEQWEKIYTKKPSFRDVAEKLSQYQEFRSDDKMKDYLTSTREEFTEICKDITATAMSLSVRDLTEVQSGCDIIAIENDSAKWRNTRKQPRLIRFLRVPDLIDESTLRALLESIKKLNVVRAVVVTSSGFSRSAQDFAESRPLELVNKDQLQELLKKTTLTARPARRGK